MCRWTAIVMTGMVVCVLAAGPRIYPVPTPATWNPMYRQAVKNLTESEILKGYPDATVNPGQPATRYEMAAVLGRLVNYFDIGVDKREWLPADVPWDHWAADACRIMAGARVYPLARHTNFHGDRRLTRGVFALACGRLVRRIEGKSIARKERNIEHPQESAAQRLQKIGVLQGYPDGTMRLDAPMPRWQMCVVINRLVRWHKDVLKRG